MSASTFMVSTSPLTPPSGCGCGCDPSCVKCCRFCQPAAGLCFCVTSADGTSGMWNCSYVDTVDPVVNCYQADTGFSVSGFPFCNDPYYTSGDVIDRGGCDAGSNGLQLGYVNPDVGVTGYGTLGGLHVAYIGTYYNQTLDKCIVSIQMEFVCLNVSTLGGYHLFQNITYCDVFELDPTTACSTCRPSTTFTLSTVTHRFNPSPDADYDAPPLTVTIYWGSVDCPPAVMARNPSASAVASVGRKSLPCVYLSEDPLLAGEVARLGLPILRQWWKCSQGYGVEGADGNGYICGCAPWPNGGCTGCDSYNADVSQSPDEVESGEPDGG